MYGSGGILGLVNDGMKAYVLDGIVEETQLHERARIKCKRVIRKELCIGDSREYSSCIETKLRLRKKRYGRDQSDNAK